MENDTTNMSYYRPTPIPADTLFTQFDVVFIILPLVSFTGLCIGIVCVVSWWEKRKHRTMTVYLDIHTESSMTQDHDYRTSEHASDDGVGSEVDSPK
jgi:hypothetical protein